MKKVILFMMTSLDGYFERENHDLSWHHTDEEFNDFVIKQTGSFGTQLYGRVTYEMMASYWPKDFALDENPKEIVEIMNKTSKVVFSKTLKSADWENTTIERELTKDVIEKIKAASEKDVVVLGSSDLSVSLLEQRLLDEVRIMVNPVVLGKGKLLFQGIKQKTELKLLNTRTFANGNVLLTYTVSK